MAHAHRHHGAEKVVTGARPETSSDMNVTPLIDVLLVLLIIFMAALPLTQKGIDINLPLEANAAPEQATLNQLVVEISAANALTINKEPISGPAEVTRRFREIFEQQPTRDKTVFIIGAPTLRYGQVMAVIDAAVGAGVEKVGIVTEGMVQEARGGAPAGGG